MGGKDPLSILGGEAGVTHAFLVSGWGMDGLDEAVLFVSRQADNSLKWHGWMRVRGGFSGERLGGIQPYQNDALGFSLYLPKDFQVSEFGCQPGLDRGPSGGWRRTSRARHHTYRTRQRAHVRTDRQTGLFGDTSADRRRLDWLALTPR